MEEFNIVPFGERSPKERDVVFVWFFARNCGSYDGYPHNDVPNTSLVLGQLRWDGSIGAIGGGVDKGEDLLDAAVRECQEEINFTPDKNKFIPLCTRQIPNKRQAHIHSWTYEVSYDELKRIRDNASTAEHFNAESAGVFLMHICRYRTSTGKEAGWNILQNHMYVGSAKLDLVMLVEKHNLLMDYYNAPSTFR